MKPVEPIVPGFDLPVTHIAKDQEEYQVLPAYIAEDGIVLSRWELSWKERLIILFSGNIYLWIHTFGSRIQPVMLDVGVRIKEQ